jgi:integrase
VLGRGSGLGCSVADYRVLIIAEGKPVADRCTAVMQFGHPVMHSDIRLIPTTRGGVLDELRGVSLTLEALFAWQPPEAARAQLPKVRVHDLRHTAATLLLQWGQHPKVVQEMLGHSTIAITMDLYSHVAPALHREAVSRFSRLF